MSDLAKKHPASVNPATKTPSYQDLIKDITINVYTTFSVEQTEITVYTNGYVDYCKVEDNKERHTVFHINKMNTTFRFVDGTKCKVDISELLNYEEVIALEYCGESRLAHNKDSQEEYYTDHHLNNDGNDWTKEAATDADIVERIVIDNPINKQIHAANAKEISNAMGKLTVKQLEIIQEVFIKNKTLTAAAMELNISRSSAQNRLDAARKKLKKLLKNKIQKTF